MKQISLIVITAVITLFLSGCSKELAVKLINGYRGGSTDTTGIKLSDSGMKILNKVEPKFDKNKGYVVLNFPENYIMTHIPIYEDLGEKLSLVGFIEDGDSTIIMGFNEGEHTIVGNLGAGPFRATFSIQKGHLYYIKYWNLGKSSIWTYGADQIIFRIDKDRLSKSKNTGKLSVYDKNCYEINSDILPKANKIINNYDIKTQYEEFIKWHNEFPEDEKEDDVFYKYTDYTLDIKDAWKIPEKYFKN